MKHLFLTVVILGAGAGMRGQRLDVAAATQLFDAYAQSAPLSASAFTETRSLIASLEAAAQPWIAAASADAERELRRRIVAMVPLELAAQRWRFDVLEWACAFLRRQPPSEFERLWQLSVVALSERSGSSWSSLDFAGHLEHVLDRFPSEGRLRLARLLSRPELHTPFNRIVPRERLARSLGWARTSTAPIIGAASVGDIDDLRQLAAQSNVRPEALAALARVHLLVNRLPESVAAARTAASEAADDAFVSNLAWLTAGFALNLQERESDAAEAFRAAVKAAPGVKSSAMMLATMLFLHGERQDAARVIDVAYGAEPPARDPWRSFSDEQRFLPEYLSTLRRMVGHTATTSVELCASSPSMCATQDAATVFRSTTSAVMVDVSVLAGKNPVNGLTAADFEVLDNDVPQSVQVVDIDSVPLDLSVILETNGAAGVTSAGMSNPNADALHDALHLPEHLRPIDRFRLVVVQASADELLPLQPLGARPPPKSSTYPARSAASALYDAVAVPLLRPTPPDRRHLVAVFTDGIDGMSVLSATLLQRIAAQSDAVIHVARREPFELALRWFLWPGEQTLIEDIARATGGTVWHPKPDTSTRRDVALVIENFRKRYLLRYTATGVSTLGWHQITVRLKQPGKYTIDARRGYWAGAIP